MKILSIRQPWAHLIVHGGKDIENRTWRTNYRGEVLVHASTNLARSEIAALPDVTRWALRFGGVIGTVQIADCVSGHESSWFRGPWGFVLRNPRALDFIEWTGALGLREAPEGLIRRIGLQQGPSVIPK